MQFRSEEKFNPPFTIQHEAIGPAKEFHSSCEKRFRQSRFHTFIRKFVIVAPLAKQNSLVFKDGIEVVGNLRFVRIQSIRVVNLLIVDVHLNIGKN